MSNVNRDASRRPALRALSAIFAPGAQQTPFPFSVVLVGAVLLPCLYLPNLMTPFDFADDGGNYPIGATDFCDWLNRVWQIVIGDFHTNGPFRPTFWFSQQITLALFGPDPFWWRLNLLVRCMFAAGFLLMLMRELRIAPLAALLATALAMWNFRRSQIWTNLGLTENIAMPFALLSLICAVQAARSSRPLVWDIFAFMFVLLAIETKNTFMAMVPVMVFLRVTPDGTCTLAELRQRWKPALILSLTFAFPMVHLFIFRQQWHPGQYVIVGPSWEGVRQLLNGYMQATSLPFLGLGTGLALAALTFQQPASTSSGRLHAAWSTLVEVFRSHRAAVIAGCLLVIGGSAVYFPMGLGGGRYSMPGVWGFDLIFAAILSSYLCLAPSTLKRLAGLALTLGFAIVVGGALVTMDMVRTRIWLLTDVLNYVQTHAPRQAGIAWVDTESETPENAWFTSEGIHFIWHLHGRGRPDLDIAFYDGAGNRTQTIGHQDRSMTILLSGRPEPPAGLGTWGSLTIFERTCWFGSGRYRVYLWTRP